MTISFTHRKPSTVESSQLIGLLCSNFEKGITPHLAVQDVEEVYLEGDPPVLLPTDDQISSLVLAGLNRGSLHLGPNFEYVVGQSGHSELAILKSQGFFNGENLTLAKNPKIGASYSGFEAWTAVSETHHISPWCAVSLNLIFNQHDASCLEVKLPPSANLAIDGSNKAREPRLDVVLLSDNSLLSFECKTSITAALADSRFRVQVPRYRDEIERAKSAVGETISSLLFLVVGGSESELQANAGVLTPTTRGKRFIAQCSDARIKFLTANALWQLLAQKLLEQTTPEQIMDLLDRLSRESSLTGLTSAGFVSNDGKLVSVR